MSAINKNIDKITKSPIVRIIAIIVVVASLIVGAGIFIVSNLYSGKIDVLESNLQRLTPTSGNPSNIDLSKFFVLRNDILDKSIPKNSQFDDENLFYYSNDKYWEYEKMNPIVFVNFINSVKPLKIAKDFKENISHVWFSNFNIDLNSPLYHQVIRNEEAAILADTTSNVSVIIFNKRPKNICQYIKLTRFDNNSSYIKTRDASKNYIVVDSVSYRELGFKYLSATFIENIFNDLYSQLPHSIGFTEFSNISLKDNWLFVSSLTTFGDKNIYKGKARNVYCFNEWYFLYTELNTFVVEVQTPSFEPVRRGTQFTELNNWLSYLRVVVK